MLKTSRHVLVRTSPLKIMKVTRSSLLSSAGTLSGKFVVSFPEGNFDLPTSEADSDDGNDQEVQGFRECPVFKFGNDE